MAFADKVDKCLSVASFYPRRKRYSFWRKAIRSGGLFFGSVFLIRGFLPLTLRAPPASKFVPDKFVATQKK